MKRYSMQVGVVLENEAIICLDNVISTVLTLSQKGQGLTVTIGNNNDEKINSSGRKQVVS